MTWKRGLTRLYVVLWAAWAVGTGFLAGNEAYQTVEAVRLAREYVPNTPRPTPGDVTKEAIDEALLRWRRRGTVETDDPIARAFGVGPNLSPQQREARDHAIAVYDAAHDKRFQHTTRHLAGVFGLWLLGGIGLPGVLLLVARWVWTGFEHQPEAKS